MCGPEAMISSVSKTLEEKGVSFDKILFELFTSSNQNLEEVSHSTSATMEIIYDDMNFKLDGQEGKSILDTALDNNLDVPYSCQGGVCSSCIARIKSGNAEMQGNQISTESEVKDIILTCQAYPTSDNLIVDYDDV